MKIGSVSFILVTIYMFTSRIFGFGNNIKIVSIGLILGFIGMAMKLVYALLEKSNILAGIVLVIIIIAAIIVVSAVGSAIERLQKNSSSATFSS